MDDGVRHIHVLIHGFRVRLHGGGFGGGAGIVSGFRLLLLATSHHAGNHHERQHQSQQLCKFALHCISSFFLYFPALPENHTRIFRHCRKTIPACPEVPLFVMNPLDS